MFSATVNSEISAISWNTTLMPCRSASRGELDLDLAAADADGAGILPVDPSEDLDQRRFAGAVLAHQRMNLARLERQVDVLQREHAGKALADPDHLQGGTAGGDRPAFDRREHQLASFRFRTRSR